MKKNVLMRTNILVCVVIVLGFLTTSIISYQSNQGIFYKTSYKKSREKRREEKRVQKID